MTNTRNAKATIADMLARWDTTVELMDDEIRDEVSLEKAPCDNETFLLAYMEYHLAKYGEEFTI